MLNFNELQILHDEKKLIIEVAIQELEAYEDVYLSAISIYNDNEINPVYTEEIEGEEGTNLKYKRWELTQTDLADTAPDNNIFKIVIITKDINNTEDTQAFEVAVYDTTLVYNEGLKYLREVENSCRIPKEFIDFILKQKALDLAIGTGDWLKAFEYFNSFKKFSCYACRK